MSTGFQAPVERGTFLNNSPSCKKVSIDLLTVRLKDCIRGSRLLLQGVGARCFAGGLLMAQH